MKTFMKPLFAGATLLASALAVHADEIVVGGKNFTEQQIIATITDQLLRAEGYEVDNRTGMGSAALRQAMEGGQIDVYWEYTGTSLITYNKVTERLDADDTYARVKELDGEIGLIWLEPSDANNTYAFAMREAMVEETGIDTLSKLADAVNDGADYVFGSNAEFYARADGLRPLQEAYDFRFARSNIKRMDTGLVYQALRDEQVDIGLVFATDGRVPAFNFVILEDDKEYFPSYALAPVVREEVLEANPELEGILNNLSGILTDDIMASLNAKVDVERVSIENVATEFLEEQGLI